MTRFPVLLLLVGLAIGLWLGFNPATHRDIERWWNSASSSQASGRTDTGVSLRQLDQNFNRWFRSISRPEPAPKPASTTLITEKQISTAWHEFLNALQRIWLSLTRQVNKAGS